MKKMKQFIFDQDHTKSIIIENAGDKLSISLVYGNIIKITSRTLWYDKQTEFFDKLKERYELWEIDDCACKPKKIRVWADDFTGYQDAIDELRWIPNINDAKFRIDIFNKRYRGSFSEYVGIASNHPARWMNYSYTNLIFTGDTFAVVYDWNYYNFRLDQKTKESEYYFLGNIIENSSQNYFVLRVVYIYEWPLILTDKEEINSENKDFIEDLKEESTQEEECFFVFDKKDVTLKINIDKVEMEMSWQECYSKVDVKINDEIKPENIICMLKHIPKHLSIRLEADHIEQIIELMKSITIIEKLRKQGTKFLYRDIEIEPRIIEDKIDEKDLKNEIKEIEAKRCRMNMDCDK